MNKSELITYISEIIHYLRIQNYHEGCMRFRVLLNEMQNDADISTELFSGDNAFKSVMMQMLQALEADDVILLADLLEEVLLPLVKMLIIPCDTVVYGDYHIEPTSSGYMTVKHIRSNLYLHSNLNPMDEARILVETCFDPTKEEYIVWGCGLGYHIVRLYEVAKGAIKITVFDEEQEILQLAQEQGILSDIPSERFCLIYDPDGTKFVKTLENRNNGILLHFPSIKKIQNKCLKDALHALFAGWNGTIQLRNELAINFRKNLKNCKHNVDELADKFFYMDIVLVAAGPSLDSNIEFLRESKEKKVIVAVTTVLKKLLKLGIIPHYAIVMDAQQRTLGHIEGIETTKVPLIVDSTAYWEFAERYEGEKYIAFQKGYEDAEKNAVIQRCKLYDTGGSVITLALDIALQSGANKIYLVGVDLAYPKGVSHASDTMDRGKRDVSDMKKVKAVHGGEVYADSLFIGYRKWIEQKIAEYPDVNVYNMSNCGANIEGTILM